MGFRINARACVVLTNDNPVNCIESFANRVIFLQPRTFLLSNDIDLIIMTDIFGPRSLNWSDDQRTSKTQNSETHACATYKKKKSTDDLALFMSKDRRMELKGTM